MKHCLLMPLLVVELTVPYHRLIHSYYTLSLIKMCVLTTSLHIRLMNKNKYKTLSQTLGNAHVRNIRCQSGSLRI
jgi:hypothetical protein